MVVFMVAGPFLLASLLIGGVVSLIQAATQISDVTMTFVPKIMAIGLLLLVLGSWMAQQLLSFTSNIFINLSSMIH
jgi:flagellar biosynthetic protein FliQ